MKSPQQVLGSVENRLKDSWPTEVTAVATGEERAWPHAFPLGLTGASGAQLTGSFAAYRDWAEQWREWARTGPCELRHASRLVAGTRQQLPSHLVVASVDDAATLSGGEWPTRVTRGRNRAAAATEQFPTAAAKVAGLVRELAELTDTDFSLLTAAAHWFERNDGTGLTPRQVPIAGLHAKWLNTRQHLVATLANIPSLGLLPPHPPRIHFTYLDPEHLAAGRRRHDSATIGDHCELAYEPLLVLIMENKDTVIHFPPVPGGIAVEGDGCGGKTAAQIPWLVGASTLLYWGDLDSYGFEILNGYRADGVPVRSVLMDESTYGTYAEFGTDLDPKGRPIKARPPRDTPYLTFAERALYERLVGPKPHGPRRIEQERITLSRAHRAVMAALVCSLAPGRSRCVQPAGVSRR